MEILEQNLDEFFNLNPYLAEMYTNCNTSSSGGGSGSGSSEASPHGGGDQMVNMSSCWSGGGGQEISPSSSTVAAAATPQLISFDKEIRYEDYNNNLAPKIINFSATAEDEFVKRETTATRTPSQAQDHLMSERKRRDNLRQLFISLSKVVPGLRKLDKASLLEDAINHLKALQERVVALEREEEREMMMMRDSDYGEDNLRFCNYTEQESNEAEISVRREERNVLIKMFCKKRMDLMSTIPSHMERIHLHVTDIRIMPFGPSAFDVTILAQMKSEFVGTVEDIVQQLQAVVGTGTDVAPNSTQI